MNYSKPICGICLSCCLFSVVFAEADFSKIEEKYLLNHPGAGNASDEVIIYSRVRNKTIHKAMDEQFARIENMMFVNTIVETESGVQSYADDEDCD